MFLEARRWQNERGPEEVLVNGHANMNNGYNSSKLGGGSKL